MRESKCREIGLRGREQRLKLAVPALVPILLLCPGREDKVSVNLWFVQQAKEAERLFWLGGMLRMLPVRVSPHSGPRGLSVFQDHKSSS